MSRRSYLVDSISDFHERIEKKSLQSLLVPDSIQRSSEYYKAVAQQHHLKKRIDSVVDVYKSHMSAYDIARRKFDEYADTAKACPPLSHDVQTKLSLFSVDVLAAQRNRDSSEAEYIRLLHEFDVLLSHTGTLRKSIGESTIKEAAQYYDMIRTVEEQVHSEDSIVDKLRSQIELTKNRYKGAMLRLEEVSNGVRQLKSSEVSESDQPS
jgi:hypothetical protein